MEKKLYYVANIKLLKQEKQEENNMVDLLVIAIIIIISIILIIFITIIMLISIEKIIMVGVNKEACSLDYIESLGKNAVGKRIFISKLVLENLVQSATNPKQERNPYKLFWKETKKLPSTTAYIHKYLFGWGEILEVKAEDIEFKKRPKLFRTQGIVVMYQKK